MKKVYGYLFCLLLSVACTHHSGWEARPGTPEMLKKVSFQLAMGGESVFEENVHSLAVYAFQSTDDGGFGYYKKVADLTEDDLRALESGDPGVPGSISDSKILKLALPEALYQFYFVANDLTGAFVEPLPGGSVTQGYLPYPPGGVEQSYFMSHVELKPGSSGSVFLFVVLTRVVSRLTVVLDGIPPEVDTVRYRVSDLASRILFTEVPAGDTTSVTGIYTRTGDDVSAPDSVINRLLLFPALGNDAVLHLTFNAGSTVVREKTVIVNGLKPDRDVYIPGRWDAGFTTPSRIFSIPFYNNSRSGD